MRRQVVAHGVQERRREVSDGIELKPCPCCGGEPMHSIRFDGEYSQIVIEIRCSKCYIAARSQWAYEHDDSLPRIEEAFNYTASVWNRRAKA